MPRFSERVDRVAGDGAAAWDIHFAAAKAATTDPDVLMLSIGDPDFSTPQPFIDQAVEALRSGDTHYAEVRGREELRSSIAREMNRQGGPDYSAENITVLAGTQNALFTASLCLLSPGDEVIALDPMYVTYEAVFKASGAALVRVPCDADYGFRPNIAAIEAAVTPRTKVLVYSNPSNPTGVVMNEAELNAIADIARRHDLWVISDEVYAQLTFENPHRPIAALPGMAQRTVTVSSLSKSHAMTGWRSGWLAGPKDLAGHASNLALCMLYGLPGFIQEAARHALDHGKQHVDEMRAIYRRRRDLVVTALQTVPLVEVLSPESGMFVLVDVRQTGLTGREFSRDLYASQKVSVLDGGAFGPNAAGFVRLSFTSGEKDLLEGCQRIEAFIDTLKK